MATIHDSELQKTGRAGRDRRRGWRRFRWTREQYYKLADQNFFRDRHVQLIDGEIIEMITNPPHDTAVSLTADALGAAFGPGFYVREEKTLDLGRRYQPVPDAAVVVGGVRDYSAAHPTTAVLVVEVSDSSLRLDRRVKAHRYAHAGIADYWIVNINDRQLEIYRNPGPDPDRKGRFRYADVTIVPADGHAAPLAKPDARISVADLLP